MAINLRQVLRDRNGREPTENQLKARERNWNIRQLRAFYHMVPPCVSHETRRVIQTLIDSELRILKAESETEREDERFQRMMEETGPTNLP